MNSHLRRVRAIPRLGRCLARLSLWVMATVLAVVWAPGAGTAVANAICGLAPQASAYHYGYQTPQRNGGDAARERGAPMDPAASAVSASQEVIRRGAGATPMAPPATSACAGPIYDVVQMRRAAHASAALEGAASWSGSLGSLPVVGVATKGVSSSGIRFSQSSANGAAEIEASMRANGWVGDAINVVRMRDGGLTSLDNTRLLAAKRAGIDVQANIHAFDDALPAGMVERFTTAKGGVPSTGGDAVMNRIGGQSAGYRGANPFGSWVTGWSGN